MSTSQPPPPSGSPVPRSQPRYQPGVQPWPGDPRHQAYAVAPRPRRRLVWVSLWIAGWSALSALLLGLIGAALAVALAGVYAVLAALVGQDATDDGSLPGPQFGTLFAWIGTVSLVGLLVLGLGTALLLRLNQGFAGWSSPAQGSVAWLIALVVWILLVVAAVVVAVVAHG